MVYFLALFIACSSNDKDQEDTQELETSADWPPPDGDWQGVVACSDVRLLASNDSYDLAVELELDVYQAVISGESVEITQSVESGPVLVIDERIETGDVCGSTEEFPSNGIGEHFWYGVSGTLTVTFVPNEARKDGGDWSYDGTELGTLTVSGEDLLLEGREGASEDWELSEIQVSAQLSVIDLPA